MSAKVQGVVRVNTYAVIADCVEAGISFGLSRVDKHAPNPLTPDQRERVKEHVEREVMNALCEKLNFN
jgi:hypothetical protein